MEKEKLTEKETNMFKHGLPDDRKVMTGLKIFFGIGWSAVLVFLIWNIVCEMWNKTIGNWDFSMLFIWIVMGSIVFICCIFIDKRNDKIYAALKKGEYEIIITGDFKKDFRYLRIGNCHVAVDFYVCPQFKGEITPISKRQFKNAKIGDKLKIVILPTLHVAYGIVETNRFKQN